MKTARVATLLTAFLLSTSCGVSDEVPASEELASPDRCRQFESISGRTKVGDPDPGPDALTPVEPGQSLEPIDLPALESAAIEKGADADLLRFEIVGDGFVAWSARFVQSPRVYETGESVPVSGTCTLQIDLTGLDFVSGFTTDEFDRLTPDGTSTVVEAFAFPTSDGLAQTFVGIRTATPAVTIDAAVVEDRATITVSMSS